MCVLMEYLQRPEGGRKNLWSNSYSCELPGVDMGVGVRSFRRVVSTLEVF